MNRSALSSLLPLLVGAAAISISGCSESQSGPDCRDGKCDTDPSNAACRGRIVDGSGTGRTADSIAINGDQFAQQVLLDGEGCPSSTEDVMKKLIAVSGCGSDANGTMVINEKSSHDLENPDLPASVVESAENFNRAVISRQCASSTPSDPASEAKSCTGDDVDEFDFIFDECEASSNTPKCVNEESGSSFFSDNCFECLTRGDDKVHKGDLRTAESRCVDRDSSSDDFDETPAFNLLLSAFTSKEKVSQSGLEVIAFDESAGVFNFYKENNGDWAFMGNSEDFQEGKGGFCKGCHPSGGLVQKELDSPWTNWEINGDVNHSDEIIDNNPDFFGGAFPLGGEGLEFDIVRPGNQIMNERRLDRMAARVKAALGEDSASRDSFANPNNAVYSAKETTEFLKPLFCTEQINFVSGLFSPSDIFASDFSNQEVRPEMTGSSYADVIGTLGQIRGNAPLTSPDSSSRLLRPANGDVFEDLYSDMVRKELLSGEFVQDLTFIDFTRPLFSDARCQLLDSAPEITVQQLKDAKNLATAITKGFIANLEAKSNPSASESEFLAALKNDSDSDAREAAATAFESACNTRGDEDMDAFMTDVVKMVELMRRETEERLEIVEGFLAADAWPRIPGMARDFTHWDRVSCTLK